MRSDRVGVRSRARGGVVALALLALAGAPPAIAMQWPKLGARAPPPSPPPKRAAWGVPRARAARAREAPEPSETWVSRLKSAPSALAERALDRLRQPVTMPTWLAGSVGGTALAAAVAGAVAFQHAEAPTELEKQVVLFGDVLRTVQDGYVEPVDTRALFERGTNAMLHSLDPFTEFENADSKADLDLFTMANYGGVGLGIGVDPYYGADPARPPSEAALLPRAGPDGLRVGRAVLVREAREGYAYDDGVRVGDHILGINGEPVAGRRLDDVMAALRGEPGTAVQVALARDGEAPDAQLPFGATRAATLRRQRVLLPSVPFAALAPIGEGASAGFIKLASFSAIAPAEMRAALLQLQAQAAHSGSSMDALVLDLRGNTGGLLNAALAVAEQLLPHGSPIVSTQGRTSETRVTYASRGAPLVPPSTRLAVLVDERTASASEIVTGAVQDLDRGLVVGTRTYGKGLVQSVMPLPYDTELKVTIAKYYTPSGRCIQRLAYDGNGGVLQPVAAGADSAAPTAAGGGGGGGPESGGPGSSAPPGGGRAVPEASRRAFSTRHGRSVRDGGGIEADIPLPSRRPGPLERQLAESDVFFAFAAQLAREQPADGAAAAAARSAAASLPKAGEPVDAASAGEGFKVTPAVLEQFEAFATERLGALGVQLQSPAEAKLDALEASLREEDGFDSAQLSAQLPALSAAREQAHARFVGALRGAERESISRRIVHAVDSRVAPERVLLLRALRADPQLDAALLTVRDADTYLKHFGPAAPSLLQEGALGPGELAAASSAPAGTAPAEEGPSSRAAAGAAPRPAAAARRGALRAEGGAAEPLAAAAGAEGAGAAAAPRGPVLQC